MTEINQKEAAQILGISVNTIVEMQKRGSIKRLINGKYDKDYITQKSAELEENKKRRVKKWIQSGSDTAL